MFGANIKLKPEITAGEFLKIHSIFHTIQGEGPFSGRASAFIRLSGCNLACKFCDTEFDYYEILSIDEILDRISSMKGMVVITGGEPFRQTLGPLCKKLLSHGRMVQVETNGTLYNEIPDEILIVCSPKNSGGIVF